VHITPTIVIVAIIGFVRRARRCSSGGGKVGGASTTGTSTTGTSTTGTRAGTRDVLALHRKQLGPRILLLLPPPRILRRLLMLELRLHTVRVKCQCHRGSHVRGFRLEAKQSLDVIVRVKA
jgi:hypothetical protein